MYLFDAKLPNLLQLKAKCYPKINIPIIGLIDLPRLPIFAALITSTCNFRNKKSLEGKN